MWRLSANRPGEKRNGVFANNPWELKSQTGEFWYDCHEELLHNPVFLPEDIDRFSELVRRRRLNEGSKTENREKLAGRIKLLHEIFQRGIEELLENAP